MQRQLDGELAVAGEVGGEVPHQFLQAVQRRPVMIGDVVAEEDRRPVEELVGRGVEHGGLGREVVEEGAFADAEPLGHVLHPGRLESLGPEQPQCYVEDRLALFLFLLLPQPHAPRWCRPKLTGYSITAASVRRWEMASTTLRPVDGDRGWLAEQGPFPTWLGWSTSRR